MTITATRCKARDLKPGDLFSIVGPHYWERIDMMESIGERVYIRTNTPADYADDEDQYVYRITILQEVP